MGTDLQPTGLDQYPVVKLGAEKTKELIRQNMGDAGGNAFDLDRVTVPTGGGTAFAVPALSGEAESRPILEGVILHWQDARAYWASEYAGGEPPQCASEDGLRGIGDPGGDCTVCPFASFGSDPKGSRGQACKQVRRLFMLMPGQILPVVVSVPPTSIGGMRKYFARLTAAQVPYWRAVTRLRLEGTVNKQGIKFSRIIAGAGAIIPEEDAEPLRAFAEALKPTMRAASVEHEETAAEDDVVGDE